MNDADPPDEVSFFSNSPATVVTAVDNCDATIREQLLVLQHTLQVQHELYKDQMALVGRDAALRLTTAVAAAKARADAERDEQRHRHEREKQQTATSLRTYRAMVLEREARLTRALEESQSACSDLANLLLEQVEENKALQQRADEQTADADTAADAVRQRADKAAQKEQQALRGAWERDTLQALAETQRRCEQQMNERIAEMKGRYEDQVRQQIAEAKRRLEERADDERQALARRHEEELHHASRRHEKLASDSASRLLNEQLALQHGMRREAEATIQKAMHSVALSCQAEKEAALRTLRDGMKTRYAADRAAADAAHGEALHSLSAELRRAQVRRMPV